MINYNKVIDNSIKNYCDYIEKRLNSFPDGYVHRVEQINQIREVFSDFQFTQIKLIETGVSGNINYGLSGLILAGLVEQTNGKMCSVDLDCKSCEQSQEIFNEVYPNMSYETVCDDSINFLKKLPFIPNIVHLDSYDFDLLNPFPSALHAFKEFELIKDVMPSGSLIIIDDNWIKNTYLQWFADNNEISRVIDCPVIGKGANIYNEALNYDIGWNIVGSHYNSHNNIKIILKKR